MPTRHIVQQGDHLSSIAKRYGFTNFLTIWNDGDNSQLRSLRSNPHVLFPGDVVVVPEKQLGDETRSTDQRHRFKLKAPALKLRIVLEDMYDQPVTGARVR